MNLCRTIAELRAWRKGLAGAVGFVPTMGALHAGHRSLLDRMCAECDHTVASIFVNPTQFGPNEDLSRYPRPFEADLAICEAAGVDCVFAPDNVEMYVQPPALPLAIVEVKLLSDILEGEFRPDHFTGVATVVAKLFNIVQPSRAYFGEKDYQQLCIIRKLVDDLKFPIEIVPCPTIRETDGLALSSRNAYLLPDERLLAPRLYETMLTICDDYRRGVTKAKELVQSGKAMLQQTPQLPIQLDYLAIGKGNTLTLVEHADDDCRVLIAARFTRPPGSGTRLIDNMALVEQAPAKTQAALVGSQAGVTA